MGNNNIYINNKHQILTNNNNANNDLLYNYININSNNNHTYRIRNKKKDYKEKEEMKINFIKNSNTLTSRENIMKFNKFNLKKYYQNKNRSKNKLVKINENSESETDSLKKIQIKNSKNILNHNSSSMIEKNDSNYGNPNLFENNSSSNLEKENLKNNLKNLERKETPTISNKNRINNEKEFEKNDSENREFIRLKNLNTNDTTSLKSSEESISNSNSFQLDYNCVRILIIFNSIIYFNFKCFFKAH